MRRYVSVKPRTNLWYEYMPEITSGDPVHMEPQVSWGGEPVRTGLLDADGNPIYRTAEPIGFLARK